MTALVVGDAAQTLAGQGNHLVLPHVGVQTPAVDEQDGFAFSDSLGPQSL